MVHLGKCLASSSLEKICDSQKLGENEYYYRWNEELAIRWLIGKVGEVACELLANEIDIEGFYYYYYYLFFLIFLISFFLFLFSYFFFLISF